jgi:hypothetical protein
MRSIEEGEKGRWTNDSASSSFLLPPYSSFFVEGLKRMFGSSGQF